MEMIGKKLKEEEDKKNVKEGGKTNLNSNKSTKPVNALVKSNTKTTKTGKTPTGKPSSSGAKSKMGEVENGICPVGKTLKELANEPARAGTTSRPVGEISSPTLNDTNLINSIIQEQLHDQLDHEDMTWV